MRDQEKKIQAINNASKDAVKKLSIVKKIGEADRVLNGPADINAASNADVIGFNIKPIVEKYFRLTESTLVLHQNNRFRLFGHERDALIFTGNKRYVQEQGPALRVIVEDNGHIEKHIDITGGSARGIVLYPQEGYEHMLWLAKQTVAGIIEQFQEHIKI